VTGSELRDPGALAPKGLVPTARQAFIKYRSGITSFTKDSFALLFQAAVTGGLPLVLIPHIIGTIGLSSFGELSIALAWGTYGGIIVQYGFHYSGPCRLAQPRAGESEAAIVFEVTAAKLLLTGAAIAMMVCAFLVFMPHERTHLVPTGIVLLGIPLGWFFNTTWHLRYIGKFYSVMWAYIGAAAISLVIGFVVVRDQGASSVTGAALALTAGPLVSGLGTGIVSVQRLAGAVRFRFSSVQVWSELREGWPLFSSQFISALYTTSGPIIIGALSSAVQAGAFAAIDRMSASLIAAGQLTHTAAYPRLARSYETRRHNYVVLFALVGALYYAFALPAVALCELFRTTILQVLFHSHSRDFGLLYSLGLVWILIGCLGTPFTGYLIVSDRSTVVLRLTFLSLTISLAIGGLLTYHMGAAGWLAGLIFSQVPTVFLCVKYALGEYGQVRSERGRP
jgi:O-antigen/teichoic acid export membrane protein